MSKIIKLSATVVCVDKRNNKILMTYTKVGDDSFNLPCGVIDTGENPHTTACREFERSTNLCLDPNRVFLAGFTNMTSEVDPFEYITMVFACSDEAIIDRKSGTINHGSVDEIRWMTVESIEENKRFHRSEFVLIQTYMGIQSVQTEEKSPPFFRGAIAT